MENRKAKVSILTFFIVLFSSVHFAYWFGINKNETYDVPVTHDYHMPFSLDQWFKGKYQLNSDRYYRENFGFRDLAIRTQNQLDYWVFKEANAKDVIVGKEGYLFEKNYIESYLGINFLGKEKIKSQLDTLRMVQDTLAKQGKTLLTVLAPGKGYFYPEHIPSRYNRKSNETNYSVFAQQAEHSRINLLDLNKYFLSKKGQMPHPLYGKNGIHWSYYGMCLATDTIIKQIEKISNYELSHASWDTVEKDSERPYDYDIASGMKLLTSLKGNKMGYPNIHFNIRARADTPSTIVIADSYYWGMFNINFPSVLGENQFWYYNRHVFPESYKSPLYVSNINLSEKIKNNDLFLIICTEGNLHEFGWGFVNDMYNHFYGVD